MLLSACYVGLLTVSAWTPSRTVLLSGEANHGEGHHFEDQLWLGGLVRLHSVAFRLVSRSVMVRKWCDCEGICQFL